jgi:hypothetical protein
VPQLGEIKAGGARQFDTGNLHEKLSRSARSAVRLWVSCSSAIPISWTIPRRTLSTPVDGPFRASYQ